MPICAVAFFHSTLCFTEVLKTEICCSIRRQSVYLSIFIPWEVKSLFKSLQNCEYVGTVF